MEENLNRRLEENKQNLEENEFSDGYFIKYFIKNYFIPKS